MKRGLLLLQDKLYISILENYIQKSFTKKKKFLINLNWKELKNEVNKTTTKLKKIYDLILEVNEPALLSQEFFDKIAEISATKIIIGENSFPLLTEKEIEFLSIKRGSLSHSERLEIESHVTHSYNFLVQIPWSNDLRDIPEIVLWSS